MPSFLSKLTGGHHNLGEAIRNLSDKGWKLGLFLLQEDIRVLDRKRREKLARDFNDVLMDTGGDLLETDRIVREKNGLEQTGELEEIIRPIQGDSAQEGQKAKVGGEAVGEEGEPIQPRLEASTGGMAAGVEPTPSPAPALPAATRETRTDMQNRGPTAAEGSEQVITGQQTGLGGYSQIDPLDKEIMKRATQYLASVGNERTRYGITVNGPLEDVEKLSESTRTEKDADVVGRIDESKEKYIDGLIKEYDRLSKKGFVSNRNLPRLKELMASLAAEGMSDYIEGMIKRLEDEKKNRLAVIKDIIDRYSKEEKEEKERIDLKKYRADQLAIDRAEFNLKLAKAKQGQLRFNELMDLKNRIFRLGASRQEIDAALRVLATARQNLAQAIYVRQPDIMKQAAANRDRSFVLGGYDSKEELFSKLKEKGLHAFVSDNFVKVGPDGKYWLYVNKTLFDNEMNLITQEKLFDSALKDVANKHKELKNLKNYLEMLESESSAIHAQESQEPEAADQTESW